MSKLFFRYSTMNAGKSIDALRAAHNYEEQGKKVLMLTPSIDDRNGQGVISSRIGIEKAATCIYPDTNIYELLEDMVDKPRAIISDESQFFTSDQITQLARIADDMRIPVMCYGLKNTFNNDLFEGSKALLILADSIEEIKTLCTHRDCERKATMVLRYVHGVPTAEGETIEIGGNDQYRSVCRKHHFEALRK